MLIPRRADGLFLGGDTPRIAIVGCGFGGITAGVALKKAGINTFTIFEKSDGPGGTWWENRYPGAEVDIPSHLYAFHFRSYDWTRTHARQPELQKYLEAVVDELGLRPHCRFGTAIRGAVWDDPGHFYSVLTEHGETILFDVVISAVGLLNNPNYPDWPGLEDFAGPKFHTARWEHQHRLAGKRVAIVGTGSTASQIVPAIAPHVGRLYVFQREPGWVIPKGDHDLSPDERKAIARPFARRIARLRTFLPAELSLVGGRHVRPGTSTNAKGEEVARGFIDSVFADRPDLRAAVTPKYPFLGKRTILNDTFYPALLRDNVELIPRAVTRVTRTGVVDADNVEREVDILVMATGFQAANILSTLNIVGRAGRSIHDIWKGEPQAFLGITVAGVPNFYMIYGPNTNGGSDLLMNFGAQAEYAVRAVQRMRSWGITSIEVRKGVMDAYNAWLQRKFQGTSWKVARNYYKAASGRIVTQWPEGSLLYSLLAKISGSLWFINRNERRKSPRRQRIAESWDEQSEGAQIEQQPAGANRS